MHIVEKEKKMSYIKLNKEGKHASFYRKATINQTKSTVVHPNF